jgi:hypothetical protein
LIKALRFPQNVASHESESGPLRRLHAVQKVSGYWGYTGRDPSVGATAARDR